MNIAEHLLATFSEECAETQQAIGKALRFGHRDGYPGASTTNAQDIEKEFIEAIAVRDMLRDMGILTQPSNAKEIYYNKKIRVLEYMEFAKSNGSIIQNPENEV
jgi:hypothetical protein